MTGDLVVGLDCSTTSTKAIAFDRRGKVAAYASETVPLFSPQANYYEQDPADWWKSSVMALNKITKAIDKRRIAALAVANQRETFVTLGAGGESLRRGIVWLDERCKDEVEPFARKIGKDRIHRITGKPPDYAPVVYRLAWMKRNEPELFRKIAMVCDVHTYVTWKLTESFKTSWASADPLGLFDLKNKKWSPVILKALGLRESQLPETYSPGTILGKVCAHASEETGLTTDTIVVAGGGDGQAAGLGSNALTTNRAYLNLGTAVVAGVYGDRYRISRAFRTMGSCSDSGYYYECSLRAGTFSLEWLLRKILNIDPTTEIYEQLEDATRNIPPGSDGLFYLPYLCGVMNPYWDANARGAFVGLSSSHARAHIYRSILEGIAFEQLFALNAVEKEIGKRVKEFVAIGGGAASDLWCTIISNVTGRSVLIPENIEASGLGAAIAAAVGVGWYANFKEAASKMTAVRKEIKPDAKIFSQYKKMFGEYRRLFPLLKKVKRDG